MASTARVDSVSSVTADRCRCPETSMTKTLGTILKKIYYDYLPNSLRKYYGPKVEIIYSLLKRAFAVVSDLYLPVTYLTDNRTDEPSQLKILIAGRGDASPFLLKQLNLPKSETTNRGSQSKTCLWNVPRIDKQNLNALLIEADRCFSPYLIAKGFVPIPEWIHLTLDISLPTEEIIKSFKKRNWNNYRRVIKHQYTYEVIHDLKRTEFFYYRMYVPFIESRHGEQATIESFTYMKNLMQYGELIFVKLDGEYVGGFIVNTASPLPKMAFRGVLDGRDDFIKKGISSAMYYSAICWAKEEGYTKIDFGHCRPFLDDGVLQFKRRWGMHMHRSPRVYRTLYLLLGKPNASLQQSLVDNPLIYEDHGQPKGLIFLAPDKIDPEHLVERLKKKYAMPGLKDFSVISFDDSSCFKVHARSGVDAGESR
jgi:hypothetical protein